MAAKARIVAALFLVCTILPSLSSAFSFSDHLPEVLLEHEDSTKKDVSIHINSVARYTDDYDYYVHVDNKQEEKKKKEEEKMKKKKAKKSKKESKKKRKQKKSKAETAPKYGFDASQEEQLPVPFDMPLPPNNESNEEYVTPPPPPMPSTNAPINPTPVAGGYGATPTPVTPTPEVVPPPPVEAVLPPPVEAVPVPTTPEPEIAPQPENSNLRVGFYAETCPNAERIIMDGLTRAVQNDSSIAAAIPRVLLHDCLVNGCDASILLDQTPSGARVEKLANPNGVTVRGFELIDEIKAELEAQCPGIVSCADLLVYLSRDAFIVSGLPRYEVPAGRRDGMESLEANIAGNLPLPDFTVDMMIDMFKRKGLNEEDLVVLIGAHSIGVAHCFSFLYRLNTKEKADMVDPRLAGVMRFTCANQMNTIAFDTTTQYKMDSIYYKQLMNKRGLLESDDLLNNDPRTNGFIQQFANDQMGWFDKFGPAMNKLASIQVLTGDQGQVRKQCRAVNV